MSTEPHEITQALLTLSRELGAEHRQLAILGEGNTSARLDDETFLVKASGTSLGTLTEPDLVACRLAPLLAMLDGGDVSDEQIEVGMLGCRVDPAAKKPSVEALFHAYFLSLPGVRFVGHAHPVSVNRILCSPRARDFAERRIFPDEVVCCGPASVFVPYADPGLKLAQAIAERTGEYMERHGVFPRVVLLESHGLIALGGTPQAVQAATYMADKAARIFLGAALLGGPEFLSPEIVERLSNRADEHYRQRMLKL
jgi:rhamnose utilization protein RhaD (predicted bifunctional aldolase and dehydrogenase)